MPISNWLRYGDHALARLWRSRRGSITPIRHWLQYADHVVAPICRSVTLRPDRSIERVYLHRAPVDMRKQIDGLAILAKDVIQQDPTSGALFAFINARRNKLKLLMWERNGFIIWYKRLERDKLHWPRRSDETVLTLSGEQLNWLLDGYDVWRMKPHEVLHFSVFS